MLDMIVEEVLSEEAGDGGSDSAACSNEAAENTGRECAEDKCKCSASAAEFDRLYYVGDMPDDMIAAEASDYDFKGIAVLYSAPDKAGSLERLKNAGASVIAETEEELEALIG